jgi:hypothetical protein
MQQPGPMCRHAIPLTGKAVAEGKGVPHVSV